MSVRHGQRVIAKTASYTVSPRIDLPGQVFTNRGAVGAVVFTLPRPSFQLKGVWYEFRGVADQDLTVAAATAGQIVAFNNAAAASVAFATGGNKIGGLFRATCDGTSWIVTSAGANTVTVA